MSISPDVVYWELDRLLASNFALVLLNQPVVSQKRFSRLWHDAAVRVAVDGGANELCAMNDSNDLQSPHLFTGDFDSVSRDILTKLGAAEGVKVVHTPDQDHTDFTKALIELTKFEEKSGIKFAHVLAFVENCGRLDQIMANVETLFHAEDILTNKPILLVSSNTLSWLLRANKKHVIVPPKSFCRDSSSVGLLPVGSPAHKVTTRGLKWDLNDQELAFGKLVSTSNAIVGDTVEVETSESLLWTMEY